MTATKLHVHLGRGADDTVNCYERRFVGLSLFIPEAINIFRYLYFHHRKIEVDE